MRYFYSSSSTSNPAVRNFLLPEGIETPRWIPMWEPRWERGLLPTAAKFPEFVAGSAFYAALFVAIGVGVQRLRRVVRITRGRCIACNYDLSGIPDADLCPECGAVRWKDERVLRTG